MRIYLDQDLASRLLAEGEISVGSILRAGKPN